MKPEAAIFDLGKVLLDFDYSITARELAGLCDVTAEELLLRIDQSHLLLDYEEGKLTSDEFYSAVCSGTGYRGSFGHFSAAFADIFSEIPPMVDLQRQLKANGIPCFIFSNTNEIAIVHIRHNFPFFANFDGYVYSYLARSMKPDTRIYEVMEETAGRHGESLIYIDDKLENIEAGHSRGWQTIHHTSPETSIAAFQAAGLI